MQEATATGSPRKCHSQAVPFTMSYRRDTLAKALALENR